ncbi:MAG TPA: hypothetical protein VKU00_22040 [Chthonomonadaceae bacterium]|nr:hypothetical protein [Chthonomonadaceae bacterium]
MGVGVALLWGCASQRPVVMAPPMGSSMPPQSAYNGAPQPATGGVYQWQDVPVNQQVPVSRAVFDQGGYQIIAADGQTIVVPFVNLNLYAMKFGRTNGQPYFVNEGDAPVLYLPPGGYLENAAASNARWYPIPADYSYSRPMYVTLAPSWGEFAGMGWYPGMSYYGGMWGYNPYGGAWMPGFYIGIGGHRYTTYTSYHSYYISNPGYIRNTVVYRNYSAPRSTAFRTGGGTGSFNSGRSTGSFNSGRSMPTGSNTGSFNSGRSFTPTQSPTRGSFNGGQSGFSNTPRTGGGSFMGGGSRPSGSSFTGGGSRPSGGSMGGGRSSFGGGGSFGRRR